MLRVSRRLERYQQRRLFITVSSLRGQLNLSIPVVETRFAEDQKRLETRDGVNCTAFGVFMVSDMRDGNRGYSRGLWQLRVRIPA